MDPDEIPDAESPEADLVFLHERGHKIRNPVLKLLFYLIVLPTALTLVSASAAATGAILGVFAGTQSIPEALGVVVAGLLVFGVFYITYNAEELAAELYAYYRLGEEGWEHAIGRNSKSRGMVRTGLYRILYPSQRTVRYVANTKLGEIMGHKPS